MNLVYLDAFDVDPCLYLYLYQYSYTTGSILYYLSSFVSPLTKTDAKIGLSKRYTWKTEVNSFRIFRSFTFRVATTSTFGSISFSHHSASNSIDNTLSVLRQHRLYRQLPLPWHHQYRPTWLARPHPLRHLPLAHHGIALLPRHHHRTRVQEVGHHAQVHLLVWT
jgi:hypothetical protein